MANKKISQLTSIVTVDTAADLFPIVDTSAVETKSITPSALKTALSLGNVDNTTDANKPVSTATQTALNAKQDTLVSATNIKTINSTSILGSGNIVVGATPSGIAGAIQFSNGSAFASDATNLFWDDTNNRLGIGTNAPSSTVDINSNTLSNPMFSVGPSFATGFQIFNTNSTGTPVYGIGLNASYINTRIGFYDTLTFRANGTQIAEMTSSEVRIGSISGARVGIKGSGSTSATTSFLVQNSAGTAAFTVKDDLSATLGGTATASTFTGTDYFSLISELRLVIGTAPNRTLLRPIGDGILCILNAAEADFNRLQLGGTTSSFPAIKRNGTQIDFRLADDSGYASITAQELGANVGFFAPNSTELRGTYLRARSSTFIGFADSTQGIVIDSSATTPSASAILQANSTTKGFLPPRMTTTQRNAISSPAAGLVVYDSTTNKLQCYNGSTWNDLF